MWGEKKYCDIEKHFIVFFTPKQKTSRAFWSFCLYNVIKKQRKHFVRFWINSVERMRILHCDDDGVPRVLHVWLDEKIPSFLFCASLASGFMLFQFPVTDETSVSKEKLNLRKTIMFFNNFLSASIKDQTIYNHLQVNGTQYIPFTLPLAVNPCLSDNTGQKPCFYLWSGVNTRPNVLVEELPLLAESTA